MAQGKLLIVDDDPKICEMFSQRFAMSGYQVVTVGDAQQALAQAGSHAFDAVLLDVRLPDSDGMDVLKILRQSYSRTQLPIIMVTGRNQSEDVVRALTSGANDYLTKPIDFPVALARIETHVSLKRAEEALRSANTELEARVQQRTRELSSTNERLQAEILERRRAELEKEKVIADLQEALSQVKTLGGLIPICSGCKKIRDDEGYWQQVEVYIHEHSGADFTHSLCPDCLRQFYPNYRKNE